jgi:DNA helicase-2/ATP-dependent DNA helicase PcrA
VVRELVRRRDQRDWAAKDMAILYRTNAQSRALEEACRRAGLPYRLIGATSFYDRREVKDLLAYLRLIANPRDDEAFMRAVNVPKRGLGEASLAVVARLAQQWNQPFLATARVADRAPDLRPNVRAALVAFGELIERLAAESRTLAPADVLQRVIDGIGYEQALAAEGPEGADRWENVRELVAGAAEWSEEAAGDEESTPLERFLAEAALLSSHDAIAGDEDGITLMTLHTAKGLEWPVVVLAGLEHGLFPLARAEETPGGLEEERRLCYVGLTRARDKLYVTWAQARRRGGELRHCIRSRFLEALPAAVVEEKRSSLVWTVGGERGGWQAGRPAAGTIRRTAADFDWEAAPAAEEPSQDAPRYVKGERVRHRRFGAGTITGLSGVGRDLKVSVAFDDEAIGTKQLLVAYAGLERDWEGA